MSGHATKAELTESVGRTFAYRQVSIFDIPPASRREDPITSKLAGRKFEREGLSGLHKAVLAAFREHGAMTALTLELLPQFSHYRPSTVRKRLSELVSNGRVRAIGIQDGGQIWNLIQGREA